ncbi:hypothetical protein D9758_016601 [Tetrapyrgos nigripes]|uniref:Uncharacterized protein n=1 Tax=Tetrapyrgos nigripes TaxID=182062 RepID=A0A8H5CFK9_9AGAR|nr:hypothetical protein D9758_016601 [Tetrapyrgos nigripes]
MVFLVFRDWVDRPVSARVKRDAWVCSDCSVQEDIEKEMVDAGLIPPPQPALSTLPLKTENPRDSTISLNSRSGKNAAVDEEEEAIRTRLEAIGLHVGVNFAERLCRETLDVIKFVCKDLWAACWDRQVDNLQTNHRGIYVLQDNTFKTITHLSSWEGRADATHKAKLAATAYTTTSDADAPCNLSELWIDGPFGLLSAPVYDGASLNTDAESTNNETNQCSYIPKGNNIKSIQCRRKDSQKSINNCQEGTGIEEGQTSTSVIDVDGSDSASESGESESSPEDEALELADEAELRQKMKTWTAPVYAFYDPIPTIEYINGRKCQVFKCSGTACHKEIRRYQDKSDANATKGLRDHIQSCKCWGAAVLENVKNLKGDEARKAARSYLKDGTITAAFQRVNKGTVTYSHRQHTKTETHAEIVCWVAESARPFTIVRDCRFMCLMKTGRPGYYLPHPTTVSRNVKTVFAKSQRRIASLLREYDGRLNFATDAWTSPNHHAYVAVTVHLEQEGVPLSFLLDFVELGKILKDATVYFSRSTPNLATVIPSMD